jgi:hypothetical protein
MLEWKSRLVMLLALAAIFAVALGGSVHGALNFGW